MAQCLADVANAFYDNSLNLLFMVKHLKGRIMNIEHITDSNYMAIREDNAPQGSDKQLGPPLKCGSPTLVSHCSYSDCPCRSTQINAR